MGRKIDHLKDETRAIEFGDSQRRYSIEEIAGSTKFKNTGGVIWLKDKHTWSRDIKIGMWKTSYAGWVRVQYWGPNGIRSDWKGIFYHAAKKEKPWSMLFTGNRYFSAFKTVHAVFRRLRKEAVKLQN